MKYISYLSVRFGRFIFRVMPFRVLYTLSDALSWILRVMIRYRKDVISRNLRGAFPEMNQNEVHRVMIECYRNLSDVMLETLKGYSLNAAQLSSRIRFQNPELISQSLDNGQSIILTMGHMGNWEWCAMTMSIKFANRVLCVYQPIKNPKLNTLIYEERIKFSLELFSPKQTRAMLKRLSAQASMMVLVADQSPPSAASAYWVDFFGIETGFVPGPEHYARRFQIPIIHAELRRTERGFYNVQFVEVYDGKTDQPEGQITQRYAQILESQIKDQPGDWLWSHKRWKKKKPKTAKTIIS